jgi:N-acetylmuramoyl-L-alanine amidase
MLGGMGKLWSIPTALLVLALFGWTPVRAAVPKPKDFMIVLDPGHGGTDYGAVYTEKTKTGKTLFSEKAAVLGLAIEVKRQLETKGYPVLLTRDRDADIALNARTAIANRAGAKIFVSIHMNSLPGNGKAEGIETYLLNSTSDRTSRRLAELENRGLDPTQGSKSTGEAEVNLIVKDMTIDGNVSESKRLACALETHLTEVTKQRTRGVKQAMFVVLLGADMPTTLVEAGFVTSEKDRKLITSEHGVRAMGAAIVRALDQFRARQGTDLARQDLARCLVSDH